MGRGRNRRDRKKLIWRKTGGVCAHCGCVPGSQINRTIDHFIPISEGGTDDHRNLIPLCKKCNNKRMSLEIDPREFYPFASEEAIIDCYRYRKEFEYKCLS